MNNGIRKFADRGGKKTLELYGKKHFSELAKKSAEVRRLKNTKPSYTTIHMWLNRTFGKANRCESNLCEKKSKYFDYALLKGRKYERRRKNFIMLCKKCHQAYDRSLKRSGKLAKEQEKI